VCVCVVCERARERNLQKSAWCLWNALRTF